MIIPFFIQESSKLDYNEYRYQDKDGKRRIGADIKGYPERGDTVKTPYVIYIILIISTTIVVGCLRNTNNATEVIIKMLTLMTLPVSILILGLAQIDKILRK